MVKPCKIHEGSKDRQGYGYRNNKGKTVKAHRLAYANNIGISVFDLPTLTVIRHTCDNPSCIEETHLIAGTHNDNMNDMVTRGRSIIGENVNTAVLTEKLALQILTEYTGAYGERNQLAQKYNLNHNVIYRLIARKTWRHLNV